MDVHILFMHYKAIRDTSPNLLFPFEIYHIQEVVNTLEHSRLNAPYLLKEPPRPEFKQLTNYQAATYLAPYAEIILKQYNQQEVCLYQKGCNYHD